MKKLIITSLLFFLTLSSSFSQEVNLKGKWKVNCALDKQEDGKIHFCDICPTTMLANNTAIIEDFEIEITSDVMKYPHDEIVIDIMYQFDKANNTFKFKYLKKEYFFKVLIVSDPNVYVLVAETGEVLYFKKVL